MEHDIDIFLFTESWIKEEDIMTIKELECKKECNLYTKPKSDRSGGVVSPVKTGIKVTVIDSEPRKSFEHMELQIDIKGTAVTILIIYRPEPSNKTHYMMYTMTEFYTEITEYFYKIR